MKPVGAYRLAISFPNGMARLRLLKRFFLRKTLQIAARPRLVWVFGVGLCFGMDGAIAAGPLDPGQLPMGAQVTAGNVTLSRTNATLDVLQSSARASIQWDSFNVGSQAQVNFIQPSASAAVLNRVVGADPSQIAGRITSNGQVYLLNPNGVYFTKDASVDTAGLVVTTHALSDSDFMAGRNKFTRQGATGKVVNEGRLTASLGGYVALLAPEVRNQGVVLAQMGTVALASGEVIELQFDSQSKLAGITATPSQIQALVDNQSAVLAPGGLIVLSAKALDRLQGGVIKNTGVLEASGLVSSGGRILLEASDQIAQSGTIRADAATGSAGHGGTITLMTDLSNTQGQTRVSGLLSAQAGTAGGDGGQIETSAAHVSIAPDTVIDTASAKGKNGSWLIDPVGFTIAKTGGDLDEATLNAALARGDVVISTSTALSGNGVIVVNGTADTGGAVSIVNTSGAQRTFALYTDGSIQLHAGSQIAGSSGSPLNVTLYAPAGNTLAGTINNAGGVTTLTGPTAFSGVLRNGTLTTSSTVTSNWGTLDGVTLGGSSLSLNGSLWIQNGMKLANGATVSTDAGEWRFGDQGTP